MSQAHACLAVLVVLFACGRPTEKESRREEATAGPTEQPEFGIVGGTEAQSSDPSARYTVTMLNVYYTPGAGSFTYASCSATVMDWRFVLTAAHCLTDATVYMRFILFAPRVDYAAFFRAYLTNPAQTGVPYLPVTQLIPHEAYNPVNADNDIGLARFNGAIPAPYQPASIGVPRPAVGENVVIAGYGYTAWMRGDAGTLRQVTAPVSSVNAANHSFQTQAAGRSNCSGDSGGPAFRTSFGRLLQVGVVSYTGDACQSIGGFVMVTDYIPWIWSKGGEPRWNPELPVSRVEAALSPGAAPRIQGWAYDPNIKSYSIQVYAYLDGPNPTGRYLGFYPTDRNRPDINAAYGLSGNHGFEIQLPSDIAPGMHQLYLYAVDGNDPSESAISLNAPFTFAVSAAPTTLLYRKVRTDAYFDHLWTTDPNEAWQWYRYEGPAFRVVAQNLPGTWPLYRCYVPAFGHYLSNFPDCDAGTNAEGLYGWVYATPRSNAFQLYRCAAYLGNNRWHHLVTTLQECQAAGHSVQGTLGYAVYP